MLLGYFYRIGNKYANIKMEDADFINEYFIWWIKIYVQPWLSIMLCQVEKW